MFGLYSYPIYIVGLVAQVFCIIHALKTGRRDSLYLLIFLPGIGALIYFFMEIWPEISRGDFTKNLTRIFLPNHKIKEMEKKMRLTDTVSNRVNLAEAYAEQKQYDKAITLAKSCLDDPFVNQTGILLKLARLFFASERYLEALQYFEKAKSQNHNKLDRNEDELSYARSLDYTGDLINAEAEYARAIRIHHSMEAMYHYGCLLKKLNRPQEARIQFENVKTQKDLHPRYVRRLNSKWIRLSKQALRAA